MFSLTRKVFQSQMIVKVQVHILIKCQTPVPCVATMTAQHNKQHNKAAFITPSVENVQEVSLIPNDYILPDKKQNSCQLPWIKATPVNVFEQANLEELSFPKLFPYGPHGYSSLHLKNVTLKQYFTCRLLNKDYRWASCIIYLFWSLYLHEQTSLQSQISIAVRTRNAASSLTVCYILQDKYKHLVVDDYKLMRSIKRTAAYWKDQVYNLLAKFNMLGPQRLFSLSVQMTFHEQKCTNVWILHCLMKFCACFQQQQRAICCRKKTVKAAIFLFKALGTLP